MNRKALHRLTLAGLLTAVAVVGSLFSFPVLGAKCAPVQHMVNVTAGVLLGPAGAVGVAFAASLLRNLTGLGSILAFPGSMIGALLCGVAWRLSHRLSAAWAGEVFGTGILGALAAYPMAAFLMNNSAAALFTFVPSFLASTVIGSAVSVGVLTTLSRTGTFGRLEGALK